MVWLLIVVASLSGLTASLTVWVRRQAFNTDAWVKASDQVLDDPQVRSVLSAYLVDQLYQNVDVSGQLKEILPPDFKNLAGPISAALRSPATEAVDRLLSSTQFRDRWEQLNRRAHEALIRILEDKTRVGSTANGVVTLDLGELVRQLGTSLGISQTLLDKIPASAGQIVVARSSQLKAAQNGYKAIKYGSAFLFILVVGLYALAVFLSYDRRKTVRDVGWAVVVVSLLLFATRRSGEGYVMGLVTQKANRPAAHSVLVIGTSLLGQIAWAGLAYGLTIVFWAFLVGPTRAGTAIRRTLAPAVNAQAGVVAGGAVALFLLLIIWSPTPAFGTFTGVIVLAALYALGVTGLRRVSLAEFPDAEFGGAFAGGRERVAALWHRTGRSKAADAPAASPATTVIDLDQLERLTRMHDAGDLTDAEYVDAKAQLLNNH